MDEQFKYQLKKLDEFYGYLDDDEEFDIEENEESNDTQENSEPQPKIPDSQINKQHIDDVVEESKKFNIDEHIEQLDEEKYSIEIQNFIETELTYEALNFYKYQLKNKAIKKTLQLNNLHVRQLKYAMAALNEDTKHMINEEEMDDNDCFFGSLQFVSNFLLAGNDSIKIQSSKKEIKYALEHIEEEVYQVRTLSNKKNFSFQKILKKRKQSLEYMLNAIATTIIPGKNEHLEDSLFAIRNKYFEYQLLNRKIAGRAAGISKKYQPKEHTHNLIKYVLASSPKITDELATLQEKVKAQNYAQTYTN